MNDLLIGIRSGTNELNCNRIICLSYLATYINVAGKHGSQQTRVFILLWLIMPDCLHRRLPSQAVLVSDQCHQCQICQKSGGGGRGSTKLESIGLGPPDGRHTTFSMSDGTRDQGRGDLFPLAVDPPSR